MKLKVWGLVKALSLIFENGNFEVWSQRGFKLKKLLDEYIKVEEVLDDEVWSWRSFKLMKFEIEELWSWRRLKLKFGALFPFLGFIVTFGGSG